MIKYRKENILKKSIKYNYNLVKELKLKLTN